MPRKKDRSEKPLTAHERELGLACFRALDLIQNKKLTPEQAIEDIAKEYPSVAGAFRRALSEKQAQEKSTYVAEHNNDQAKSLLL